MTTDSKQAFEDDLRQICMITESLSALPAVRTGAGGLGGQLSAALKRVKEFLIGELSGARLQGLGIKVGAGAGYVARVPWLYISKSSGPVSETVGIAICFGRNGTGFVVGKMHPIGVEAGQLARPRRKNDSSFIDVDGDSTITRYNSRFVDPVEFYMNSFSADEVINRILEKSSTL